jgi:hypothetical protein
MFFLLFVSVLFSVVVTRMSLCWNCKSKPVCMCFRSLLSFAFCEMFSEAKKRKET